MSNSIVFSLSLYFFLHFIFLRLFKNSVKLDNSPWPMGLHDWFGGVSLVMGLTWGLSTSLNTLHTLSFSYFLGSPTLHFLMYCFLFLPKYLCLVFEISLVTCELGKSSCLTSSTSPLQSLLNVHFCFKPWCFERESDKETPFHLRMRAVSSQETLRMSLSQALASSTQRVTSTHVIGYNDF